MPKQSKDETLRKWKAAVDLRVAGCTYDQIAEQVGYKNKSGARAAVLGSLSTDLRESVQALKAMEDRRLDKYLREMETNGDPERIKVKLAISKNRRDLHGLDAPAKQEHSGPDGTPIRIEASAPAAPDILGLREAILSGDNGTVKPDGGNDRAGGNGTSH